MVEYGAEKEIELRGEKVGTPAVHGKGVGPRFWYDDVESSTNLGAIFPILLWLDFSIFVPL